MNRVALTIEQVVGKRRKLVKDMCDNLHLGCYLLVQGQPDMGAVLRTLGILREGEGFRDSTKHQLQEALISLPRIPMVTST